MISEISFLWRHTSPLVLYFGIESDYCSQALEVLILFFNLTVQTQKAKRAKTFYSLLCLLPRLTNRITDKWTVGYLSVHVFSTKVLIEDTIFASHTTDGTHIFCGYLSHAEVKPFAAGEGQFLQDISQSYQDRAIGPVPVIKPATSRSSCQSAFPTE